MIRLGVAAVLVCMVTSCNLLQGGHDGLGSERDLEALEQEILAEIGGAETSHVRQCRTIAFGSKPCGGPWRYLVYSREVSDEERLKHLVATYNALQRKRNDQQGLVSDCMLVARPDTTLVDGQCRAE